tara:strand:- start:584 stop:841 length:258 start_codon:yes stop_codon:yes gene_type:complete
VDGFKNQTWLIIKYDSLEEVSQERIPQSDISEIEIIAKLAKLSGQIPQKDSGKGSRIIYMAGENPHWVASLWRADELKERDMRDA